MQPRMHPTGHAYNRASPCARVCGPITASAYPRACPYHRAHIEAHGNSPASRFRDGCVDVAHRCLSRYAPPSRPCAAWVRRVCMCECVACASVHALARAVLHLHTKRALQGVRVHESVYAAVRTSMCACGSCSQAFQSASAFNANIGAWNTASVSNMAVVCAARAAAR